MYNQVPSNQMNPQFPPPPGYNQPHPQQPPNPAFDPYAQQQPNPAFVPADPNAGYDPYGSDALSTKLSESTRMGFIRKVYGILSAQLTVTAIAVCLTMIDPAATIRFYRTSPAITIVVCVAYMVSLYALGCYRSVARQVPTNYILLTIFTCCMSYLVGGITVLYPPETVLAAAVLTAALVIGLTVYAVTTKTDFTYCGGAMWAFFFIVLTCTIMSFFMRNRLAQVWLSGLVIFIMSFYIIYDTQLIVGNHVHKLEIDDYVFAAMMLYIDIIRLFLEILKILGRK